MFYVCNSPDPMVVPMDVGATFFETFDGARYDALNRAGEGPNGLSWYIHEFPLSTVVYRASAVITIDSEVLNGTPDPS